MDHPANDPSAPQDWINALDASEAQVAAGQTFPLEPVLEQLRAGAERIEARRAKAAQKA